MTNRISVYRALVIAAAVSAILTLFLPIVVVIILAGGIVVGGSASPWQISPLISTLTALFVVALTIMAISRTGGGRRFHLLSGGCGLLLSCVLAVSYTYSRWASFGFHPLGVLGLVCCGLLLLGAGLSAERSLAARGCRFGLQAMIIWVTLAALICGFVRAAIR